MLTFCGHSDDVFMVEGDISDELHEGEVHIGTAERGLVISGEYGKRGVWEFTLSGFGEDPCPEPFPTRVLRKHEYSLAIEVDCPKGTPMRCGTKTWNTPPSLDVVQTIVKAHGARDIDSDDAMERLGDLFRGS